MHVVGTVNVTVPESVPSFVTPVVYKVDVDPSSATYLDDIRFCHYPERMSFCVYIKFVCVTSI